VFLRDYREAAEQGDTFADIWALTLFRWKVTGAVAVVLALLVALAHGCLPGADTELLYSAARSRIAVLMERLGRVHATG
jgi:S-DNA-T family DNA segregation ATPase FtsK/SpoIIIE